MNNTAKLKAATTPEEFKQLCQAATLANSTALKDGISISQARETYKEIYDLVEPLFHHEVSYVRGTAKNIKKRAYDLSREGMFGDGIFLID